jgi:hypothetical protein
MKQREAVYAAIKNVFADAGISFEDGQNANELMTEELRKNVHAIVIESFKTGKVEFKETNSNEEKMTDGSKLNSYVSGLISNWLRKDKRLNGAVAYKAKNPGSRVGATDPQIKALRQLYKQFSATDETKAAEIKTHLDKRIAEVQIQKAKAIKIDTSALPQDLIDSLGIK